MGRPTVVPEEDEEGSGGRGDGLTCCCGCCHCSGRNWSWLLYILVLASLSLSILVFWLSLYKTQEVGLAAQRIEQTQNDTVAALVQVHLAKLRPVVTQNERSIREHAGAIAELRRILKMPASSSISATAALHSADTSGAGAEAEDNYDYVVEMITDVRSTHANIINKLMEKMANLEATNELALIGIKRLRSRLDGSGGGGKALRAEVADLREKIREETKARKETIGKVVKELKSNLANLSSTTRATTSEALIRLESTVVAKINLLERRFTEESGRLRTLEENLLQMESDVEENSNTTAYLEHRMLLREETAEGDTFEKEVLQELRRFNASLRSLEEERLAEETNNQSLEAVSAGDDGTAVVLSHNLTELFNGLGADVAALRVQVLGHVDAIAALDDRLSETSRAARAGRQRLVRLSDKVDYFRQNVLKVKKLPAMMNALERRIEALDENLLKLLDASLKEAPTPRPPTLLKSTTMPTEEMTFEEDVVYVDGGDDSMGG